MLNALLARIKERDATIVVVGLGYVGLPLALGFVEAGLKVIGVDVDEKKVSAVREGRSPVQDVDQSRLSGALATGLFLVGSDFSVISGADAVVLCVPTPLGPNKEPDLSHIRSATASTMAYLRPGTLISLESTTYPGTTDELIVRSLIGAGWHPGKDVFVCFSPERVDPGNRHHGTQNTPKVVSGTTAECRVAAVALYETCIERVVLVSSTKVAEMSKLLENTFRSVNIAFINEMALLCERMGISIWEVIDAAATKPFGFMPFYPGPGIGGHCIPLDPAFLGWKAKENKFYSRFIELAQEINETMPRHVVRRVADVLNLRGKALNGSTILLLGMTYKPDVEDLREAPSLEVYKLLVESGARITISDPFLDGFLDYKGQFVRSEGLTPELVRSCDCVVVLTAHSSIDYEMVSTQSQLVLDTRNAIKFATPTVIRLGEPLPTLPLRA